MVRRAASSMTVRELIQELEGMDEAAEVRLAFQPSYPLQYRLGEAVQVEPGEGYEIYRDGEGELDGFYVAMRDDPDADEPAGPFHFAEEAEEWLAKQVEAEGGIKKTTVYLVEAGQVYDRPYLPGEVSRAIGWR